METAINSLLSRFNVKLQRNRPRRDAVALFLMKAQEFGVGTLLDIGANVGQFALDVRSKGWSGPIVSFEPLPAPHATLAERAGTDTKGWVVPAPVAIGAEHGEAIINVARNMDSSSLLPVGRHTLDVAPGAVHVSSETIQVRTLDSMIDPAWPLRYAMKIDTQGFELEVLKGAVNTIERTAVVLVEMSLAEIYRGGARFAELYSWLEDAGFRCIALPETFVDTVREEILQVDGVFIRDPL